MLKVFLPFLVAFWIVGGDLCAASLTTPPEPVTLVPYHGPVYNIFFHPLIYNAKKAFAPSPKKVFMDEWFITVDEFKKTLHSLYQRGYILVRPRQFYQQDSHGHWFQKRVDLPRGKKPLILSEDDVNYYPTMRTHGVISRLWVDPQGRLAGIIDEPNGNSRVVYHAEVPQILEDFVKKHPDFSFEGARGMINETGYYGAFGYPDVGKKSFDQAANIYEAKRVAAKLKQMGWEFASHSFDHEFLWQEPDGGPFEKAERKWMADIGTIVGPTPYYVFPFGDQWFKDKKRMAFLNSLGFRYFFSVDNHASVSHIDGDIVLGRVAVDGRSLRLKAHSLQIYLNANAVLDPLRSRGIHYSWN